MTTLTDIKVKLDILRNMYRQLMSRAYREDLRRKLFEALPVVGDILGVFPLRRLTILDDRAFLGIDEKYRLVVAAPVRTRYGTVTIMTAPAPRGSEKLLTPDDLDHAEYILDDIARTMFHLAEEREFRPVFMMYWHEWLKRVGKPPY